MIKLPKEVNKILKTIEGAGHEAYVVGGSIRDTLLGNHPKDWDIASSASAEEIKQLFPKSFAIGERYGVVRITEGEVVADAATFRVDGDYTDFRRPDDVEFIKNIEEDLKRRDFTINAIAANPERGLLDPYGGRADLQNKLIRTVGDSKTRFEEDPLRILRGIRFAAQLDFKLDKDTLESMKIQAHLLERVSVERIREEFEKIVTSKNSSKGLRLCIDSGVLPYILGEDCINNASKSEKEAFTELTEKIDRAKIDREYRVALVYLCFEKNKALKAIDKMKYDNATNKKFKNAIYYLEDLSFVTTRIDLKCFIYRIGSETYDYLENLSKQQRKVYDLNEYKIRNRMTIYENIIKCREPIFIEDLAINGDDLIEIGIEEGENIGKMLKMLLDAAHRYPQINNRNDLIKKAKEFNRNPISALLRKVKWYK